MTTATQSARSTTQAADRLKALDAALSQIDKVYGKGSIMRFGDHVKDDVPSIPTGSISLDKAIGINGIPRGRIIEIYGPESSGKTTLALSIASQVQKMAFEAGENLEATGVVAYIDAEHALDPSWAKKIGVNVADLLISQPNFGEQALDIVDTLVRSNAVDLIVVDSVAALTPKAELEGDMDESQVGLQARMMSKAMRKLTSGISQSRATVIFINQIREKIGVTYGSPETQPGGRALKFAASLRLDIRRVTSIMDGEKAIGNAVRVKVVKNKVAAPFTKAEFSIMFDSGIDSIMDAINIGILAGYVVKSGAWFSYDNKKYHGISALRTEAKDNPALLKVLMDKARAADISLIAEAE